MTRARRYFPDRRRRRRLRRTCVNCLRRPSGFASGDEPREIAITCADSALSRTEGPYGLEFNNQTWPVDETFMSVGQAQSAADRRRIDSGHNCDKSCSAWINSI